MRLLAFILIWASLAVGVVSATTAYMWQVPREGGGERFLLGRTESGEAVYATLAAEAGKTEQGEPIAEADTPLTPDVVRQLRDAGVERVRVKEFRPGRWTHLPHFVAACVGLVAGAILTRLSTARAVRLAERSQAVGDVVSPETALRELRSTARALMDDAPKLGEAGQVCREITLRLGDALRDWAPAIPEARDRLVARLGLAGYAGLMDAFASGERSLNRAWSAAADGALGEAMVSLGRGWERLGEAEERLAGGASASAPSG